MELRKLSYKEYENRGEGWQYYTSPEEGENHLPIDSFKPDSNGNYFEFPCTLWGDYCGDIVGRANYKYMEDNYSTNPLVFFLTGGYSSHIIVCHVSLLDNEEIKDILDGLDDYPLINDEHMSNIEMEEEDSAWESWIKGDLIRALDDRNIQYNEESLYDDYRFILDDNNIDGHMESAVSWYVDINRIADNWNFKECPSCNKRLHHWESCDDCPLLPCLRWVFIRKVDNYYLWKVEQKDNPQIIYNLTIDKNPPADESGYYDLDSLLKLKGLKL